MERDEQSAACRLVGLNRSSLSYRPKRPDESKLRQRPRELAAERRHFGYRRLGWPAREGHVLNSKKLYRLYCEEKLMVRRRGGGNQSHRTRVPMLLPNTLEPRLCIRCTWRGRCFRVLAWLRLQPRVPGRGG